MFERPEPIKMSAEVALGGMERLGDVADFARQRIQVIERAENDAIREAPARGGEIKSLARRAKDAIFYYTRFVVLAGAVLQNPGHGSEIKSNASDNPVDQARFELVHNGITREQRQTYKPIIAETLARGVDPMQGYKTETQHFWRDIVKGRNVEFWSRVGEKTDHEEDAWRMYLGMPQQHDTFGISQHRPTKARESTPYYYTLNGFLDNPLGLVAGEFSTIETPQEAIRSIVSQIDIGGGRFVDNQRAGEPMGHFTWTRGADEKGSYISYYDKWNLDIPMEQDGFIGKPFEIYDRLYYDPATFEPLSLQQ